MHNAYDNPSAKSDIFRDATLIVLSTLTIMSGTVVSPSLPGMVAYFGGTPDVELSVQLIMTMPAIAIALTAPLVGILADRIGRRRLLLLSVLIYGLSGSAGLYLDSIAALIVSRIILGMSVAGIMVNTTTLVGDYFVGQKRIEFMGYRSTFISIGGIVFLVGGGLLAEFGWRSPFFIYLAALLFLPPTIKWINEPDMKQFEPDAEAPQHGILQEHLRHVHLYLMGMLHFIAFYFVFTEVPFRMQEFGENSSLKLGIALGSVTAFSAVFSWLFPRIGRLIPNHMVFSCAFMFMAAGYFSAYFAENFGSLIFAMALVGSGTGLLIPNLSASAVSRAVPHMRGRVAGIMSASVFFGQFISPLVTFPIVERFNAQITFAILASFYLIASLGIPTVMRLRSA